MGGGVRDRESLLNKHDPACLDFASNTRAVRTASAGQGREALNRKGVGRWRHYRQWLGPIGELSDTV